MSQDINFKPLFDYFDEKFSVVTSRLDDVEKKLTHFKLPSTVWGLAKIV